MHRIDLLTPVVDGSTVTFRWRVQPATALYRRTQFTLTFPTDLDLSKVPARLWWDVLFICLHPHWLLLRPCRIHLPLRLAAAERLFWLQLLQNGFDTLAAYGPEQTRGEPLGIAIIDGETELSRTPIAGSGIAAAFSGGKDSLLQAGLLCELTDRPLLVTTTSPLPSLADHETERRRHVLRAIQERRPVRLIEVMSDFRSTCENGFAGGLGCPIAVSELTDTFLYMSSLLAASAALGATRLFMASEAEVQANALLDGKIVQHSHFMYSAATQRALARYLAPYGIRFGSLTWPLYSIQVQQLLWVRYPDLCDLQYSCWSMRPDQAACSACEQCFRIAVTALADGEDPQRIGIDLRKVFAHPPDYAAEAGGSPAAQRLPQKLQMRDFSERVLGAVGRISLLHLARVLAGGSLRRAVEPDTWSVLRKARQLRAQARALPKPPPVGVREAFFDWLDPELRDRLVEIYTRQFPREPRREHFAIYERSRALTLRATAPLDLNA